MNTLTSITLAVLLLAPLAALHAAEPASAGGTDLEKAFVTPPDAAKPSCYWMWFNNNVDKQGITRDLEEFKAKGMGGAYIYCLAPGPYGGGPIPNGPAYLTPEWRDLLLINDQNQVGKQTASAAHIYGRKTASAESFTSFQPHWDNGPALLKPIADRAFCEGINRLVFHTMTSQRPQDGKPGYEFGAGTHFNPNVTWWQQVAGPWISYVSRCQALLQSGLLGPVRIMKGE